jgi:hypothetical protein
VLCAFFNLPHILILTISPSTHHSAAFFGLAGVTFMAVPRLFNSRHADDMPTLTRDWKREEAKRSLSHAREGAPGAPVVLNPIRRDL